MLFSVSIRLSYTLYQLVVLEQVSYNYQTQTSSRWYVQ